MTHSPPTRGLTTLLLATVAVVAMHLAYVVGSILLNRVGFDTAYNLTVSRNLAAGMGYVSDGVLVGVTPTPFDVRVSTGPTVLVPASWGYLGGDDGLFVARLIACSFYAAMVVALVLVGNRVGGRWAALLVSLSPLTFDMMGAFGWSELLGPTDVVGEMAATAFILFSILVLARGTQISTAFAGVLLGLAVVTKLIAAITAPAFLVAILVCAVKLPIPKVFVRAIVFGVCAAMPMLFWQFTILLSLGPQTYVSNLAEQIQFVLVGGSGLNSPARGASHLVPFLHSWHIPVIAAIVVGLSFTLLLGALISRLSETPDGFRRFVLGHLGSVQVLVALSLSAAAWIGWWVFLAGPDYARAVYPGAVMLSAALILGTLAAIRIVARSERRLLTVVSLTALTALASVQSVATLWTVWNPSTTTIHTQRAIGAAIGDETERFIYWQFANARQAVDPFSIAMANGMTAVPLDRRTDESVGYIPMSVADADAAVANLCDLVLYNSYDVIICSLKP